jgi:cytochrome c oxidase cbb3-type subunit 3
MNWLDDNVNVLALIGAAAIIIISVFVIGKYIRQMQTDTSTGELSNESWDGIGEYKNPLPFGWSIIFLGTIVWALWYFFIGYPLNGYSQIGEYNQEVAAYNTRFESKWANPDDETLLGMGEGVFLVQCAPCHGVTGDGINGKSADLTNYLNEAAIIDTIAKGSKGSGYPLGEMPAGLLDPDSAKAVAAFIEEKIAKNGTSKNHNLVEQGSALWATCAACHGQDGKGMGGSAPSIADYGKKEFIANVLNHGKKGFIGEMPAFNDGRLTNIQKLAVGRYVTSLSEH